MALVSYSDSESSDDERPQVSETKNVPQPLAPTTTAKPAFNSLVEKSNPRKIQVNLQERSVQGIGREDREPATKRPGTGAGGLGGFNAMLPAPKRTTQNATSTSASKGVPRKVFSLKTGAEPGFDRSADAELKQLFTSQNEEPIPSNDSGIQAQRLDEDTSTNTTVTGEKPKQGNPMMFKPLSVARGLQKKKKTLPANGTDGTALATRAVPSSATNSSTTASEDRPSPPPAPKVSLFSMRSEAELPNTDITAAAPTDYEPLVYASETAAPEPLPDSIAAASQNEVQPQSNSLTSLADSLNLSASARRQLLGRHSANSSSTANIIHFDTSAEYSANEALRASGEAEANQHRSVKAIAPGKHSLKQLISSASGQMEALEDSFAAGRRKKGEAGSRYGW